MEWNYQRGMVLKRDWILHRVLERQTQPIARLEVDRKPRIGQGRAGMRRKALPTLESRQRDTASKPIVITDDIEAKVLQTILEAPVSSIYPPYVEPFLRPPPKPQIINQRNKR